jgi:hypothetical protein
MINLTPHAVRVVSPDGTLLAEYPASGLVARVSMETAPALTLYGQTGAEIPVCTQRPGPVTGLPPVRLTGAGSYGELYIVSAMVRTACPDRRDLFSPGELVRGADGQPTGCLGLVVNGGAL